MKISEAKTKYDVKNYIDNSKSWKKGWRASHIKWVWLTENEEYGYNDFEQVQRCGFCHVEYNIKRMSSYCRLCPIVCNIREGIPNPANFVRFLDYIKPRIWALKPGEVLKDKIVYNRDRIY